MNRITLKALVNAQSVAMRLFTLAYAASACAPANGEDAELIGEVAQGIVCGDDDNQHVERYIDREGVPNTFIMQHQGPVGEYGCSGTLIGEGLFLTAAHCLDANVIGAKVNFNYQLDAFGIERASETYKIAQRLEDDASDHGLVRLYHSPENRMGEATLSPADPVDLDPLVVISHGNPEGGGVYPDLYPLKRVDVGYVHHMDDTTIYYSSIDSHGGSSGASVLSPITGSIVGINRAHTASCGGSLGDVANKANRISRIYGVSEFLQRATSSVRHYSFSSGGATQFRWKRTGWSSAYRHIVAGRFRGLTTQELFLYNSESGTGEFIVISNSAPTGLGTPLNIGRNWTQIVPIQLDATPQDELLFYSSQSGRLEFHATDGQGNLTAIRGVPPTQFSATQLNTSTEWRLIVAGQFTNRAGTELLFYKAIPGEDRGEFHLYGTNTDGTLAFIKSTPTSARIENLVVGEFSPAGQREVLAYDPIANTIIFYRFDDAGTMTAFGERTMGTYYTHISTGNFIPSVTGSQLMFYQPSPTDDYLTGTPSDGVLTFYTVNGEGVMTLVATQTSWDRTTSKMIPGKFTLDAGGIPITSLVFYHRFRH